MVLVCLRRPQQLYWDETNLFAEYTEKFIYALGGVTMHTVALKTIEKYDVERNKWRKIKCQLMYERTFASQTSFKGRYIYIFGGNDKTDCIEMLDTQMEDE